MQFAQLNQCIFGMENNLLNEAKQVIVEQRQELELLRCAMKRLLRDFIHALNPLDPMQEIFHQRVLIWEKVIGDSSGYRHELREKIDQLERDN